jgi:hypothetical protein
LGSPSNAARFAQLLLTPRLGRTSCAEQTFSERGSRPPLVGPELQLTTTAGGAWISGPIALSIIGFFAATWGVGLLVESPVADRVMTATASGIGGLILLGVSYALYRSLATSKSAPRT